VANEIASSRRLFARNRWPVIDVTRRSIEETHRVAVDVGGGIVGLEAEQAVLADLDDPLRRGDQPDDATAGR
jgi:hypothetical protein